MKGGRSLGITDTGIMNCHFDQPLGRVAGMAKLCSDFYLYCVLLNYVSTEITLQYQYVIQINTGLFDVSFERPLRFSEYM